MIIEKDENELIYQYFDDLSIDAQMSRAYLGRANEYLQNMQNTLHELKMLIYLNGEVNEEETC